MFCSVILESNTFTCGVSDIFGSLTENMVSVESAILAGSVLIGFKTFVLFKTFDSAHTITSIGVEDSDGGVISDNIVSITAKKSPSAVSVKIINYSKQVSSF